MHNSGRRRIMYVDCAPTFGGSIVVIRNLLKGLDQARFEPLVLLYTHLDGIWELEGLGARVLVLDVPAARRFSPPEEKNKTRLQMALRAIPPVRESVRAARFASQYLRYELPIAHRLKRIVEQEHVDLVHLNDEPVSNREGIVACRVTRTPCICHVHQFGSPNLFDRVISGTVDFTIYNSRAVEQHWQRLIPFARERVVYNGLDVDRFRLGLDRSEIRRELGLAPEDFVVLSLGRITAWKGQHVLIRSLSLARTVIPNLVCLFAGAPGMRPDLAYHQNLVHLAGSLGLSPIVRFLGHRADVDRVLAAADVLVHTSTSPEPFGLAVIEGMAAGVPVVATRAGGVPEIIEDGQTGLLVPPGDAESLSRALVSLAANNGLARWLAQHGRSSVEKRFTMQRMVREVEEVYDEVLGRRTSGVS